MDLQIWAFLSPTCNLSFGNQGNSCEERHIRVHITTQIYLSKKIRITLDCTCKQSFDICCSLFSTHMSSSPPIYIKYISYTSRQSKGIDASLELGISWLVVKLKTKKEAVGAKDTSQPTQERTGSTRYTD